jgi:plasmid stabilization system protein ParE
VQKYNVKITRIAEFDIYNIYKYILVDNEPAAIKWIKEIRQQIDSLGKFPLRCQIIPEAQELGEKHHHLIYGNYRTIFKIKGLDVIIMRVIHSARLLGMRLFEK